MTPTANIIVHHDLVLLIDDDSDELRAWLAANGYSADEIASGRQVTIRDNNTNIVLDTSAQPARRWDGTENTRPVACPLPDHLALASTVRLIVTAQVGDDHYGYTSDVTPEWRVAIPDAVVDQLTEMDRVLRARIAVRYRSAN